jgi:3-hydroxyisobutyrate dehydrogenase-like beta-hydroxyacid dehydrogenase
MGLAGVDTVHVVVRGGGQPMEVGFVGLGAMGQGMAHRLLRTGHAVTVWNRTRAKAEALAREGAAVASTPAEAARSGVVMTMLADDRAVEAAVLGPEGIRAGLPRGGLHVSMSTISPEMAERLRAVHAEAGQLLVSAPVFGRPDAAAAGKLTIVAAGPADAVGRVRPLLEVMSQRIFVLGDDQPQANLVKLAGNFMITAAIESLAEALALVGKAGIDRNRFVEIITGTLFSAPVYQGYARVLLEERFSPPGFKLPLGAKDNRLFVQAGERHAVPLPLASLVHDRMLAALARGWSDLDWSVFARIASEEAGVTNAGARGGQLR